MTTPRTRPSSGAPAGSGTPAVAYADRAAGQLLALLLVGLVVLPLLPLILLLVGWTRLRDRLRPR